MLSKRWLPMAAPQNFQAPTRKKKFVGCTKTTGKKDREQELSDKVLNLDFSDLTHEKLNGFTKIPIDAD